MTRPAAGAPRSAGVPAAALGAALVAAAVFVALGIWQLERRVWKLDLIDRVEQRVHAPPAEAPGPAEWPQISVARDEYRHVRASGRYLFDRETRVQAVTELGGGWWVMTPLQQPDGSVVLVNRGFVPPGPPSPAPAPGPAPAPPRTGIAETSPPLTVTGLLRLTEPGGGFLRHNDPPAGRWYSRDVAAIAAARGLGPVAPYFIDRDAAPGAVQEGASEPVGGLTVIAFRNHHLVYALTWFVLALMAAAAALRLLRDARRPGPETLRDAPDG